MVITAPEIYCLEYQYSQKIKSFLLTKIDRIKTIFSHLRLQLSLNDTVASI